MKRPRPFLRVLIVLNAVLLTGGCMAYRSGAFKKQTPTEQPVAPSPIPEMLPGSKSINISGVPTGLTPAGAPRPPAAPPPPDPK